MAGSDETSATPGRKTSLRIDVADEVLVDPVFAITRKAHQMDTGNASQVVGMRLSPGLGWILKEKGATLSSVYESASAQEGALDSTTLIVPSGFECKPQFRQLTELTGGYAGASVDLATTGMLMFRKLKDSAHDWDDSIFHLAADRTAFPPPAESDDLIYMDRVAVGVSALSDISRAVTFSYSVPSSIQLTSGCLFTLYVNGPAGFDATLRGFGQYGIKVFGDGLIQLFERGNPLTDLGSIVWQLRKEFQRDGRSYDPTGINFLVVQSTTNPGGEGAGAGGAMHIVFAQGALQQASFAAAIQTLHRGLDTKALSYPVPRVGNKEPKPIHFMPVRVDMRRTTKGMFGVALRPYRTSGSLLDLPFALDFYPTINTDFSVEVYGEIPSGTTMVPRFYRADGSGPPVEITPVTTSYLGGAGVKRTFTPPVITDPDFAPCRTYQVQIEVTSDGTSTPVMQFYRVIRDGMTEMHDVEPTVVPSEQAAGHLQGTKIYGSIAITGPSEDMTLEQATVHVNDPLGDLATTLGLHQSMPATIESQWSASDATKRTVLFRGDVERAVARKRGRAGSTYPSTNWKQYDVTLLGPWHRLEEALVPYRFNWDIDPYSGPDMFGRLQPYRVTEIIRLALSWGGFSSNRVDIPDESLRLWGGGTNGQSYIEAFASVAEFVKMLAEEYFAGVLVYDYNAGTQGKWKLIKGVTAPFDYKAAFYSTGGTGVAKTLQHVLDSYPATSYDPGGGLPMANVPTCYTFRDTVEVYPTPIECNIFSVSGSGDFTANGYRSRLTQTVVNTRSFDFFGINSSDPTDPAYLNRVKGHPVYIDPGLDTPEAVNWKAMRLAQYTFTPTKKVTCEAPLLLIAHEDDATKRRPLRYGDAVFFDGVTVLVRNVNPKYSSDRAQMAYYEFETPRAI